jgi:hypothetical protein
VPFSRRWLSFFPRHPLERINRKIGRRTDVVGIFPDDKALIRLATSVVIEQNDEWFVGHREAARPVARRDALGRRASHLWALAAHSHRRWMPVVRRDTIFFPNFLPKRPNSS